VAQQTGLPMDDLLRDLRLITLDGQVFCGADVYRQVLASSPWTRPLAQLTRTPLLRQAFDGGYRLFARHRYRVSAACGWAPPKDQPR
jgi:predicted DCC family thiol-disulfide oxidoreductase YuxK